MFLNCRALSDCFSLFHHFTDHSIYHSGSPLSIVVIFFSTGEERLNQQAADQHRDASSALLSLQRETRTKLQAVTAALQRLDAQDQQVASEAASALRKQV